MKLILVRHGQSTYNLENRFTGWKDVDLTNLGIKEAAIAGKIMKDKNISFTKAFASNLKRSQKTLDIILNNMSLNLTPTFNEALNERDYGDLIGQNKEEAAKKFGKEQVQIWRRSYDIPPPGGESLKMTCERTLPYFERITSKSLEDDSIIIAAHGNSIRAIVMKLLDYTPDQILKTEIGWCEPWIFTFNNNKITNFEILKVKDKSDSNLPVFPNFK